MLRRCLDPSLGPRVNDAKEESIQTCGTVEEGPLRQEIHSCCEPNLKPPRYLEHAAPSVVSSYSAASDRAS